jgi:hypothetical protein
VHNQQTSSGRNEQGRAAAQQRSLYAALLRCATLYRYVLREKKSQKVFVDVKVEHELDFMVMQLLLFYW